MVTVAWFLLCQHHPATRSRASYGKVMFTGRNEVVAKVIFLHLFVILFTGGDGSPVGRTPLPGRTPCQGEHPPRTRPPCQGEPPPGPDPPARENLPRTRPPNPPTPAPDPPGKHTAAYGQRAAGMHPTGMHFCFIGICLSFYLGGDR